MFHLIWNNSQRHINQTVHFSLLWCTKQKNKIRLKNSLLIIEMHSKQTRNKKGKGTTFALMTKGWLSFSLEWKKPPTFCHLSNASHKCEQGLQLNIGAHTLTSVPSPQRLGTAAAWLPWPDTACWTTTASEHTWGKTYMYVYNKTVDSKHSRGCLWPWQATLTTVGVTVLALVGQWTHTETERERFLVDFG